MFAPGNRILFYSLALLIYSSVTTSFRLITRFSFVETVQQFGRMRPHKCKWIVCSFLRNWTFNKRAFFAFSVAFLILNSWNIWFTFTAKWSWCLSVLAKNQNNLWVQYIFFYFYIFWSFHNCTRLCWTAKANRSHHVASQNIEKVIYFFLMNAFYRLALAFASWRVTHLWQYVNIYFSIVCLQRKEGNIEGTQYRNTLRKIGKYVPKYRVENRRNTDIAFMIGHAYLKLYPSPMFISNIYKTEINLTHREKRWEETSNWSFRRSKSPVIGYPANFIIDRSPSNDVIG